MVKQVKNSQEDKQQSKQKKSKQIKKQNSIQLDTKKQISPIPRYCGVKTFFRRSYIDYTSQAFQLQKFDSVIVGVPFDSGASFRTGQREGPAAVRSISHLCQYNYHSFHDKNMEGYNVVDAGDIPVSPHNIDDAVQKCKLDILNVILPRTKTIFVVGGDHTISYPVLAALSQYHNEPISLIHFDSHYDTNNEYFGCKITHGTPFRRAMEESAIDPCKSIHLGIHGPKYMKEIISNDLKMGFQTITSEELVKMKPDEVAQIIKQRVNNSKVYISIDVDVLEPSVAPGTGTPECGGMQSRELFAILRALAQVDINIIGGDVMEVCPQYDVAELTSLVASKILYELLAITLK